MGSRESADKLISHAVYGAEMYGAGRIFLQFLAKLENVVVDRASGGIVLVAPNFVEQFVAANDPIRILHEELEGLEFLGGQNYDLAIAFDFHFLEVGGNAIEADELQVGNACGVAKSGSNARQQFARTERFGHVIVGAQLK